jgi:hypothetical protein
MSKVKKETLLSLLILCFVVPTSIFSKSSPPQVVPTGTTSPQAPLEIPNPLELATRIPSQLFGKLMKKNPFQAVLEYIEATKNPQPAEVPLTTAIAETQEALARYQQWQQEQQPSATLPDLESAEFGFKVTETKTAGVDIGWYIITLGAKHQVQNVKNVTFTYAVPKATKESKEVSLAAEKTLTLQEDLVATLQRAVLAAKNDFTWGGKNKFTKTVTLSLEYGVAVKLEAGAKIPVYTLIVGPSASWDRNAVQSIKLTLKFKSDKE